VQIVSKSKGNDVQTAVGRDLWKTYRDSEEPVDAVRGVSLTLAAGEFVAIMGPSGCGKSTLLHLCGAMDRPSRGVVEIEGVPLERLNEREMTRLRRERIGFVFQFFNLLSTLTVWENIALPLLLAGVQTAEAEDRARSLAVRVGLDRRLGHYIQQLSGGELQRAAIARAVIHRPALLIADEPTGNLDTENGAIVLNLLSELSIEEGITVLLATHASEIASAASRILLMRDGVIEETLDPRSLHPTPRVGPHAPV